MRLRTYLIRRAIHTVITLLVVLVLLFLIFRLMPGDPSRFFIAPGQPPQVREEICVSFGLCKWVSAPGHGYEAQIRAGAYGPYNTTVFVNDTAGGRATYTFVYNRLPTEVEQISFPAKVLDVTLDAPNATLARPTQPDIRPGDSVAIKAKVTGSAITPTLSVLLADSTWTNATGTPVTGSYFQWVVP